MIYIIHKDQSKNETHYCNSTNIYEWDDKKTNSSSDEPQESREILKITNHKTENFSQFSDFFYSIFKITRN